MQVSMSPLQKYSSVKKHGCRVNFFFSQCPYNVPTPGDVAVKNTLKGLGYFLQCMPWSHPWRCCCKKYPQGAGLFFFTGPHNGGILFLVPSVLQI